MILPIFIEFSNTHLLFNEDLNTQNIFIDNNFTYSTNWLNFTLDTFLVNFTDDNISTNSLNIFIDQLEDLNYFNNLENITSIYHYSIPNTKLSYPEPFIASASFMHTDLWFVHILIYQYWLWFIFIFIIIFFFLTFISVIRWCNMRTRPKRETRGVSRSKCGDLITACVPVSWAASIIINESTDAIDFYDGFGTTELVIGIRAYQWGWEYYYPKDIDLNYNIKKNYSAFIGNSLKYNVSTSLNLKTNNLWKFYQNKISDTSIIPAHFLLLTNDNDKLLNFLNFNDLGSNTLLETNAFKKTKMFFKFNNNNITYLISNNNNKFKNNYNIFYNANNFYESINYGLKRQHNFLNTQSLLKNLTFLNNFNALKLLTHSYFFTNDNLNNIKNYSQYNNTFFNNKTQFSIFNLYFNKITIKNNNFFLDKINFFEKILNFQTTIDLLNLDSEKKYMKHPIYKLINLFNKKNEKNNFKTHYNLNVDNFNVKPIIIFTDKNFINKNYQFYSNNQLLTTTDKTIVKFLNNNDNVVNNKNDNNTNIINIYINKHNLNSTFNLFNNYHTNLTNFINLNKITLNKIFLDAPHSPIISNNSFFNHLMFDDVKNSFIDNTSTIFQSKEETLPNYLTSIYWNFYFNNTSNTWRFYNNMSYELFSNIFCFPLFNFYYDYDFRNWQTIEFVEDAFWENLFSLNTYEENSTLYSLISNDDITFKNFNKHNIENKLNYFANKIINFNNYKDALSLGNVNLNLNYSNDYINNLNLINTNNFNMFSFINSLNNLDDTYEFFKNITILQNFNNKLNLNYLNNFFQPFSFVLIFDMFRSDYEDFNWYQDNTNFKIFTNENFYNINKAFLIENMELLYIQNNLLNKFQNKRFNNFLNLRNTIKNSMVTYNALQKVFRSRLDEGRSNTKLLEFSNFYTKQPYLNTIKITYEKLLGKTKENFYKTNFYKFKALNNFNNFYSTNNNLNFYTYDFPFLLAQKSDASRHLWFDWFAKWGFCEIQPSSTSRYAIHGMPYFNKYFDFSSSQNELLNETETYLLRISKARKNYLPNWAYTPYFYSKTNTWYKYNLFYTNINFFQNKLNLLQLNLNFSEKYWTNLFYEINNNSVFTPSNSNLNSYSKSTWKPLMNANAYYYNLSNLVDILTKREYIYRQYLAINNKIINLPINFTNNPQNELFNEIKSIFFYVDPLNYNNEYSKENYYNSLKYFNHYVLKTFLLNNTFLNYNTIVNYYFSYFFHIKNKNKMENNIELYKNQYRPLKKGVNNMLRLHATGAIAMPIEIRLQILASSKDVIHSWAIPSAGVKIDCVPGYSSHRVMVFLVSGIFWGQCMEICGRYHHWMPIVVYFMKRDLFFLWCTHFVFMSNNNTAWTLNDKQNINLIKTVSYDKNSWVTELTK